MRASSCLAALALLGLAGVCGEPQVGAQEELRDKDGIRLPYVTSSSQACKLDLDHYYLMAVKVRNVHHADLIVLCDWRRRQQARYDGIAVSANRYRQNPVVDWRSVSKQVESAESLAGASLVVRLANQTIYDGREPR